MADSLWNQRRHIWVSVRTEDDPERNYQVATNENLNRMSPVNFSWSGIFYLNRGRIFKELDDGEKLAYSGTCLTPHVMTVKSGEDITMKVISYAQKECQNLCILSAIGSVSYATLSSPKPLRATQTYEGFYEIIKFSGTFIANDIGITQCRSGAIWLTIASPEGHVFAGEVAGLLIAATPVQVVLGSFVPERQLKKSQKKQRRCASRAVGNPINCIVPKTGTYSEVSKSSLSVVEVNPVSCAVPDICDQKQIPESSPPVDSSDNLLILGSSQNSLDVNTENNISKTSCEGGPKNNDHLSAEGKLLVEDGMP